MYGIYWPQPSGASVLESSAHDIDINYIIWVREIEIPSLILLITTLTTTNVYM